MATPAIEIESLVCAFGGRRALGGVSFNVAPGGIVGLLGPNGSGKTTLFRVLSTLLAPTSGTAHVFGHDVLREAARVRRHFGVVFQSPSLDRKLTIAENLRHQADLYGLTGGAAKSRCAELLERVRLTECADSRVEALSGGMARRVEIAKGLLHRPRLLLLDEPSTGLDPGARRDLWELLSDVRRVDGVTVFFTTHLMEEAERADRLVILDAGRVVADGAPEALRSSIGGDVIRVESDNGAALRDDIAARFGCEAALEGAFVRIERPRGHEFVPMLVEAFPGRIRAVSVGKPTLDDVFLRRTGHHLYDDAD
ncbi:MAG: ATP-binding cassette domain-containing protein [Phycisphaerae bacterium]|nr:ATP-binding cassette domain-containing protein [Phycisphaerae bacterium]NUQ45157.1 ATP-binding cassette domain-containing protein [Phycisphaerae bacterium]